MAARERALEHGADAAWDPSDIDALPGRVDVALEFVGRAESVEAAVRSLDRSGRAVVVGIGADRFSGGGLTGFVMNEREIVGSVGAQPTDVRDGLDLLARGALALPGLVGDRVVLEDILTGIQRVADGRASSGRVIVDVG